MGRRCDMSEPSHGPPLLITRHDVRMGPPHEGELVEGVMLLTDRGYHPGHPARLPGGAARGALGLWRPRRFWRTWARHLYAAGGRAVSGTDRLATAELPFPQRPARVYTGCPRWGHLSAASQHRARGARRALLWR